MPRASDYIKSCKDCPERTITCKFDGSCDKYKKEIAAYNATTKAEQAAKNKDKIIGNYEADNIKRVRKKKGQKVGLRI